MEEPLMKNKFVARDWNSATGELYNISFNDTDEKAILNENKNYNDMYSEMHKQEANQQDAVQQYYRSWIQTVNLLVGCIVLGVLIHKQK